MEINTVSELREWLDSWGFSGSGLLNTIKPALYHDVTESKVFQEMEADLSGGGGFKVRECRAMIVTDGKRESFPHNPLRPISKSEWDLIEAIVRNGDTERVWNLCKNYNANLKGLSLGMGRVCFHIRPNRLFPLRDRGNVSIEVHVDQQDHKWSNIRPRDRMKVNNEFCPFVRFCALLKACSELGIKADEAT